MFTMFVVFCCIRYREIEESNKLVQWFWQVLESFSNEERVLFMRFVSGRSRLPANPADITQRFQIMKVDRVSVSFLVIFNVIHSFIVCIKQSTLFSFFRVLTRYRRHKRVSSNSDFRLTRAKP